MNQNDDLRLSGNLSWEEASGRKKADFMSDGACFRELYTIFGTVRHVFWRSGDGRSGNGRVSCR